MIIKPKIRGFVCVTAHPEGCAAHVRQQIEVARSQGTIEGAPKRVLVVGASTGYGLASRIVAAFGGGAKTIGVFFERPSANGKPASAGWYNSVAFEREAEAAGLWSRSLNGDAFSDELKEKVLELVETELGGLDMLVYSLASPRRTDPDTGETYRSVLKPLGQSYSANNLDTDKLVVSPITIEPATEQEATETVKVMGGEDWSRWVEALAGKKLLAKGFRTVAFDYIGPEVTWPIYTNGTIGGAKKHLRSTAELLTEKLQPLSGAAYVAVNKAVVTQASSAIPVVPLYISILFRVMKEKGLHEDCIEQINRLFRDRLSTTGQLGLDELGRIRMDDLEMREDVQAAVRDLWPKVDTNSLNEITDYAGYRENFLRLFGFGLPGVDYEAEVDPDQEFPQGRLV